MKRQLNYQILRRELKTASLIVSGEHTRRRSPNTKTPQKTESREDDLLCRWRERLKNLQEVGIYILSYQCHANDTDVRIICQSLTDERELGRRRQNGELLKQRRSISSLAKTVLSKDTRN